MYFSVIPNISINRLNKSTISKIFYIIGIWYMNIYLDLVLILFAKCSFYFIKKTILLS